MDSARDSQAPEVSADGDPLMIQTHSEFGHVSFVASRLQGHFKSYRSTLPSRSDHHQWIAGTVRASQTTFGSPG
eukprot:768759-Hanusia_phi.AAC.28